MEALRTDVGRMNSIRLADLQETVDCLQARHVCQTHLPCLKTTHRIHRMRPKRCTQRRAQQVTPWQVVEDSGAHASKTQQL